MARKDTECAADNAGTDRATRQADKNLDKRFHKLERAIDQEFAILAKTQGYAREELEELRWDYRYDWAPRFKLNQQDLEYFASEQGAVAAGAPVPKKRRDRKAKQAAAEPAVAAAAGPTEYARKSDVDMDLIEKFLDRKIYRNTRNEMARVYKEAFGDDLVVPERVDLVDLAMPARGISEAHRAAKPTKAEIFGLPVEKGVEAAATVEAPKVEAAPKVKRESSAVGIATAYKRGDPQGPTRDEKWSVLFPFKFWLLPKRWAGTKVSTFYILFVFNLILFVVLLFPPILLVRGLLWAIVFALKVLRRFVAPKVGSKMAPKLKSFQDKMQGVSSAPPSKGGAPEKPPT